MNKTRLAISVVCSLLVVHCGGGGKKGDDKVHGTPLYQQDLATLGSLRDTGPRAYDNDTYDAFSKVFGGNTGDDVKAYLSTRIHYVWDAKDFANVSVTPSNYADFTDLINDDTTDAGIVTMAENVSGAIWLESRFHNTPATIQKGDITVDVNTSRTGIIALGGGYNNYSIYNNEVTPTPALARISTVIHEARHSDCTGGMSEEKIQAYNDSWTLEEFAQKIGQKQITCGHLHVKCPDDSDYHGESACDYESWGAYGVEAVYLGGVLRTMREGTNEYTDVEADYADILSRLLELNGLTFSDNPDMSSQDD